MMKLLSHGCGFFFPRENGKKHVDQDFCRQAEEALENAILKAFKELNDPKRSGEF